MFASNIDRCPPYSENMYGRASLSTKDAAGPGGLGGLLGGLGGAVTCLCCLAAMGLIGLWGAFIPLVAYFKYAYDQDIRAYGGSPSIQNLPQIIFLLVICLLTIGFVRRQISA